jgi:hypothetical protein
MLQVYHFNRDRISRDDLFEVMMGTRNNEGAIDLYKRLWADGAYDLVGEVEGSSLEDAWLKTQNDIQTSSWSLEPLDGAKAIGLADGIGHRSSMMGDIVVADGVMFVADMVGFTEIGPLEEPTNRSLPQP